MPHVPTVADYLMWGVPFALFVGGLILMGLKQPKIGQTGKPVIEEIPPSPGPLTIDEARLIVALRKEKAEITAAAKLIAKNAKVLEENRRKQRFT